MKKVIFLAVVIFIFLFYQQVLSADSSVTIDTIRQHLTSLISRLNTISLSELIQEIEKIKQEIAILQGITYTPPTTTTIPTTPKNPYVPPPPPPMRVPQNCSIVTYCRDNANPVEDCASLTYDTSPSTVSTYGPQGRPLCPASECHSNIRTVCPEWEKPSCDSIINEQNACLYLANQRTSESGSFDISGLPISSATEAAPPPIDATPGSLWVAPAYRIIDASRGGQFISDNNNDVWCKYTDQQLAIDCGTTMVGSYCLPNWNPPGCVKK